MKSYKPLYYCITFLSIILLSACNDTKKTSTITDFIPDNAQSILLINNIESFKTNLNNNHFIGLLSKTKNYQTLSNQLNHLKAVNTTNPIVICFSKNEKKELVHTLITKNNKNLFKIDTVSKNSSETFRVKNNTILKLKIDETTIYNGIRDNILISSSNRSHLENILNRKNNKINAFEKQLNATDKNAPFSIILNKDNSIKSLFYEETLSNLNLTDYFSLDVDLSQDQLLFNGITKAKDSSSLINVFKNTIPQENKTAKIVPGNSDGFLSFTFDNYEVFHSNLNRFNSKNTISTTTLFDNITEIGVIYENNNRIISLHSIDPSATKEALLGEQNTVENYRQVQIFNYRNTQIFKDTFSPFINHDNFSKYCVIDSFFIFANSTESLQNIISNYLNETTLNHRNYYTNIVKDLSDQASVLQILQPEALQKVVLNNTKDSIALKLSPYKTSAIQFVYDANFAHVNSILRKNKKRVVENSVTEILNIKLESALLNEPQLVTNHRTREKEIVVQDVKNKLHLISNTGQILWKKQLDGPILGRIEQVDLFKNGYLQLVFATPNAIHIIARNGKEVAPFPLKFNDEITQPLSVFDYDKKRDYRLFVTQGKNVLLYNGNGKTVKGFEFSSAKSTINHQPQHLRIGSKDYIVIKTNDAINILTRRGKPRVTPKTKLKYDDQAVFNYNGTFVTTTKSGKLATIDRNGNVTVSTLLGEHTNLLTTTKTLVAQNENKLKIKSNNVELDYATYSKPKLFYIRNKIYVSVTNLQSHKVLLFDSQGKSLPNFPVYGNSTIELNNIDRDSSLEFITKGEANNILIYEIN